MSWISLDAAKEYLGIAVSDTTEDENVERAIRFAVGQIEGYCRRKFKRGPQVYEDFREGQTVYLANCPVSSIDKIYLDGVEKSPTYKVSPSGVLVFTGALDNWGDEDTQVLRIEYTGGYTKIPDDLMSAGLVVVRANYNNTLLDPNQGPIRFERIEGSISLSYGDPLSVRYPEAALLAPVMGTLDNYVSDDRLVHTIW